MFRALLGRVSLWQAAVSPRSERVAVGARRQAACAAARQLTAKASAAASEGDQQMRAAMKIWRDANADIVPQLHAAAAAYERDRAPPGKAIQARAYAALWLAQHRDFQQSIQLYEQCVRDADQLAPDDVTLRGKLYQQFGVAANQAGRFELALATLQKALPMLAHADQAGRAMVNLTIGSLLSITRRSDAANYAASARHLADAARLYEEAKNVDMQVKTTVLLAREHAAARHLDRSNAAWDDVLQLCEPLTPTPVEEWEAYFGLGENYAQMGDAHLKLALSSFRDALSSAESLNNAQLMHVTRLTLARLLLHADETKEALLLTKKAVSVAADKTSQLQAQLQLGQIQELTDAPAAKNTFEEARAAAATAGLAAEELRALNAIAGWHARHDSPEMATQFYKQLLRKASAAGDRSLMASVMLELGLLQTKLQDVDGAVEAFEQAAATFESMAGAELQLLHAYTHLAAALRTRSDNTKADEMFARAVSLARVLNERGLLDGVAPELLASINQKQ